MKNKGRSAAAAVNVRHAYRALLARMRSNGLLAKDYTVLVVNTHLTGDFKLVADQISEWARLQTPIIRLWLLGNRARRTHSPDRKRTGPRGKNMAVTAGSKRAPGASGEVKNPSIVTCLDVTCLDVTCLDVTCLDVTCLEMGYGLFALRRSE